MLSYQITSFLKMLKLFYSRLLIKTLHLLI